MLDALDDAAALENIFFPSSLSEYVRQSEFCRRGCRNPLTGYVSALDGPAVRIQRQRLSDVPNPTGYYNRNGCLAVSVQAAVGADVKFQFLSVTIAGSCHDSTAFFVSGLEKHFSNDSCLPRGFWVAADDAYTASMRILTPWPGRHLVRERDASNYWQSSSRIFDEQTFGQLIGRWGILWKPMRFSLPVFTKTLLVCAKIHNFLIDRDSCSLVDLLASDIAGGSGQVHFQGDCDMDEARRHRNRTSEKCPSRVTKTRALKSRGTRRPAYKGCNF